MSTGERVARHYRPLSTVQLQDTRNYMRNSRRIAGVNIVLAEREAARQQGRDAANLALSLMGGGDVGSWIPRLRAAERRAEDAGDHGLAESAGGYLEALHEYRAQQAL